MSVRPAPVLTVGEFDALVTEFQRQASHIWKRLPEDQQFGEWMVAQQHALKLLKRLRPKPVSLVQPQGQVDPSWRPRFPGESNEMSHGS